MRDLSLGDLYAVPYDFPNQEAVIEFVIDPMHASRSYTSVTFTFLFYSLYTVLFKEEVSTQNIFLIHLLYHHKKGKAFLRG